MKKENKYGQLLSLIYSTGTWNGYSKDIVNPLLKIVGEYNSVITDCLDLACGQGVLVETMRNNGINAIGMDLSIHMLMKNPNLYGKYTFLGDMRDFCLDKKFDLITCVFNSINHLANVEELEKTFINVKRHLRHNGVFFFDVLNCNVKSYDNITVMTDNNTIYSEKIEKKNQLLNTFFYENENRLVELISQYLYSETMISKCAKRSDMIIIWKGDCLPGFKNKFQHRLYFIIKSI